MVNACYSEVRRQRRWLPSRILPGVSEPAAPDEIGVVHDRDELEQAFRSLSVDHRSVIILHHYIGLSMADTARALGVREGTVRSRLYYAMRSLRAVLRPATEVIDQLPIDNEVGR